MKIEMNQKMLEDMKKRKTEINNLKKSTGLTGLFLG